jgi:hypothetical protein
MLHFKNSFLAGISSFSDCSSDKNFAITGKVWQCERFLASFSEYLNSPHKMLKGLWALKGKNIKRIFRNSNYYY